MRTLLIVVAAMAVSVTSAAGAPPSDDQRLAWWREARFGMFIHWGLYAIPGGQWPMQEPDGGDENRARRSDYGEWIRSEARIPLTEYDLLARQFNPVEFDADRIVSAAREAGMKYIVITTKHHDGFCLFDSALTEFDIMSTPFGRDIMKEMAEACRRQGVRIGWYYSIMDWHHPDYLPRREWEADRPADGADFERYVEHMKGQIHELLTKYGDIGVMWLDGQWEGNWNDDRGRDLERFIRELQPSIIINSRVGRSGGAYGLETDTDVEMLGDYATPEQFVPDRKPGGDWETCMTMNGHWGFCRADENFKSSDQLIRHLSEITGKGGNFLLNVGPDATGRIPEASLTRLGDIGRWMAVNAESIQGTTAGPFFDQLGWGSATQRVHADGASYLYLHILEQPDRGGVRVPGLLSDPLSAKVLGMGNELRVLRTGDDVVLMGLPSAAGSSGGLVVRLELTEPADVAIAPEIRTPTDVFVEDIAVTFTTHRHDVQIRYDAAGRDPTAQSPLSTHPLILQETATVKAACFRNGVRISPIAMKLLTRATPTPSKSSLQPGLIRRYYEWPHGDIQSVAALEELEPISTEPCTSFSIAGAKREKHWGFRFDGALTIAQTGVYRFSTASDDGSRLWIGDQLVVDNDKPHSFQRAWGDVALEQGVHPISVVFFENWGGAALDVKYGVPGGPMAPLDVVAPLKLEP